MVRMLHKGTLALAVATVGICAFALVTVGGARIYVSKDIIDNAVNSKDHITLVAAVKAAGLVDTRKGFSPFTVSAPINAAFAVLLPGTVYTLLNPDNNAALTGVLTYHAVCGKLGAAAIMKMIKYGDGKATINTLAGGNLVAMASSKWQFCDCH